MNAPLRLPALTLTTRHTPVVYPWQCSATLPRAGVLIGVNQLAGSTAFAYDPWECYAAGVVSSPNMVVLGQLGTGKSALVKTYLRRQIACGRQAFVLDPKGEYAPLATERGLAHVQLSPGGQHRVNPLDPPPGPVNPEALTRARAGVVAALAGGGLGRELSAEERAGITAAVTELGAEPILADVATRLLEPSPSMAAQLATTPDRLAAAVRPAALELRRLLDGDLAGMVDGPSTVSLDPDSGGVVVDLSAVQGGDGLIPVMVCAGGWLTAALDAGANRRRLLLVDEAWALLHSAATTRWLQGVSKLARRHGIALITVVHRLSDLSGQADAGTATAARAQGLLADAETKVVYRQAPGERALAADLIGLTGAETDLVCRLTRHRALWLVGSHVAVVDHVLAPDEIDLVDTDARMQS
jgi:type IV secretory pathway VirB4 component